MRKLFTLLTGNFQLNSNRKFFKCPMYKNFV